MNNREFRNDVQEIWLDKFAESSKAQPFIQPKIITTSDMIRLTGHFAAGCAVVIGVIGLAIMVVMG